MPLGRQSAMPITQTKTAKPTRFRQATVTTATVILLALAAFLGIHYASRMAGDAIIHLCIMERSARGQWFQFNNGLAEASSTSILWTILGAALMRLGGVTAAVIGIKVIGYAAWGGIGLLCYALARHLGAARDSARLGGAIAIAMPGTAMNALMGMENGFFAFLVLTALLVQAMSVTRSKAVLTDMERGSRSVKTIRAHRYS
jgi:hypothetical protein